MKPGLLKLILLCPLWSGVPDALAQGLGSGIVSLVDTIAEPVLNTGYDANIRVDHTVSLDTMWITLDVTPVAGGDSLPSSASDQCVQVMHIAKHALGINPGNGIPLDGPTGRVGMILTGNTEPVPGLYELSYLVERGIQLEVSIGQGAKAASGQTKCMSALLSDSIINLDHKSGD